MARTSLEKVRVARWGRLAPGQDLAWTAMTGLAYPKGFQNRALQGARKFFSRVCIGAFRFKLVEQGLGAGARGVRFSYVGVGLGSRLWALAIRGTLDMLRRPSKSQGKPQIQQGAKDSRTDPRSSPKALKALKAKNLKPQTP